MLVGYVASRLSRSRETLHRLRVRAVDRARGAPNLDRLVAQGLELGEGVFIASNAYLDISRPWLITIGDHAALAPRTFVLTHDTSFTRYTGFSRIARVVIGKRVLVGAGAIILPGSRIGDDSIVGAGAVVHGDFPAGSVVVGNPAKVVAQVKLMAAWQRAEAASAPTWPYDGWSNDSGITDERRRAQREALAGGISGYVASRGKKGRIEL